MVQFLLFGPAGFFAGFRIWKGFEFTAAIKAIYRSQTRRAAPDTSASFAYL